MALTVTSRGTGTHNTGATTLVPGGRTATLAVGSLGVFCIAVDNAGGNGDVIICPTTWTDAKGNVWTRRASALYDNGAASAGIEMGMYTAPITVALLTTDAGTITWNTGVSPVAKAWTWYEVIPSNGITPAFLNSGTIAGATAANAQVITAESINVGDAVIAGYFSENVAAVTGDSDSTNGSWTAQQTVTVGTTTSGVRIATQQKVQTTAASTQSYDVTVSSQDRIAGYISVREVIAVSAAPTAASLTTTGATPTVTASDNKAAAPTSASLTATGSTPTVTTTANQTAAPTAASLTTTGATPAIALPVAITTSAGSLTTSGTAPTISTPVQTSPTSASLALTPDTPAVLTPVVADPAADALTITGDTPTVSAPVHISPDLRALVTSLATPAVTIGATGTTVVPDAAALVIAPVVPGIAQRIATSAAALAVTGATPTIGLTSSAHPLPIAGSHVLTGARPVVTVTGATVRRSPRRIVAVERIARPVRSVPGPASASLSMAVPTVTVRDDGDVMRLLELVA